MDTVKTVQKAKNKWRKARRFQYYFSVEISPLSQYEKRVKVYRLRRTGLEFIGYGDYASVDAGYIEAIELIGLVYKHRSKNAVFNSPDVGLFNINNEVR